MTTTTPAPAKYARITGSHHGVTTVMEYVGRVGRNPHCWRVECGCAAPWVASRRDLSSSTVPTSCGSDACTWALYLRTEVADRLAHVRGQADIYKRVATTYRDVGAQHSAQAMRRLADALQVAMADGHRGTIEAHYAACNVGHVGETYMLDHARAARAADAAMYAIRWAAEPWGETLVLDGVVQAVTCGTGAVGAYGMQVVGGVFTYTVHGLTVDQQAVRRVACVCGCVAYTTGIMCHVETCPH